VAGGNSLPPDRKVLVLWVLLAGVFAAFNATWYPVRSVQAQRAPANFEAYAEILHRNGHTVHAARQLQAGLRWFRPPFPGPYLRYAELAEDTGSEVPLITARGAFYTQLAQGPLEAARIAELPGLLGPLAPGPVDMDLEPALALWRRSGLITPRDLPVSPAEAAALVVLAQGACNNRGNIGTAGRTPVPLLAASGDRAVLIADGLDFGGAERGIYVAILNPHDGRAMQLGSFDLWESWAESRRMTDLLQRAPVGSIGVFAVCKDASVYFDYNDLAPELEAFGIERQAMVNDRMRFYGLNYTFAAIGVKGGTGALQAWSPGEFDGQKGHPVCVAVGTGDAR
jgi:hypothetical protein